MAIRHLIHPPSLCANGVAKSFTLRYVTLTEDVVRVLNKLIDSLVYVEGTQFIQVTKYVEYSHPLRTVPATTNDLKNVSSVRRLLQYLPTLMRLACASCACLTYENGSAVPPSSPASRRASSS